MSSQLYQMMGNQNRNNFFNRFMKFKQSFQGDPQKQLQELLNSGRVSQAQYNAAVEKARMLQQMMGSIWK